MADADPRSLRSAKNTAIIGNQNVADKNLLKFGIPIVMDSEQSIVSPLVLLVVAAGGLRG